MKLDFPVEKTVKSRRSVRTYEEVSLSTEEKEQIDAYINSLSNPFSVDVSFRLLESKASVKGEKLGIKGARDFIGATVAEGELALEALGYSFEKLILYATSLGLGTCWLGGTFNRSEFASAMDFKENEPLQAISPIGVPSDKKRISESIVRWIAKANKRKDWNELFFKQDCTQPLAQNDAGEYAFPLEMLRLAPSAANEQPWRIIQEKDTYHFYEAKTLKDNKLGIDIQRIDIGIAACHFHLSALEKGLEGRFEKLPRREIWTSDHIHYIFSWVNR